MEAQSRADVEARVSVMNPVEPPEEGQLVVGSVPEVGDGIESEDAHGHGRPPAGSNPREQPDPLAGRPCSHDPAASAADHGRHERTDRPDAQIRAPRGAQALMGTPVFQCEA
jgi:hypothetical protein